MRKALYLLGELDEADIRWMARQGETRRIPAGDVLIHAGAKVEAFYVVVDGQFTVELENGAVVARIAAGDILGEMSFVEKRLPTVSVRAATEGKVLALSQERLRDHLETDPGFAARFYKALAVFLSDRLRATVARLGYGEGDDEDELARLEDENELDEGLLDNLHVAGDRMRRLTALLQGGE